MNELLYIDGQLADLDENVSITLNYKSNFLTDLSKIVGNNSYTIKLPKTHKNLRLIGCSDVPAVVTSYPRVQHECRYFRNGVEIIPNGKAVLLSVSDTIEMVIVWGNTSAFYKLVEDNININEFPNVGDYVEWLSTNTVSAYDGTSKIINADIDFGLGGVLHEKAAIHPSVRSTYVLDLISQRYGITFEFPEDKTEFINSLIIPLLTRNAGYANTSRATGYLQQNLSGGYGVYKIGEDFDNNFEYLGIVEDFKGTTQREFHGFKVKKTGTVTINPSFYSAYESQAIYYGTEYVDEKAEYLPYTPEVQESTGITYYNYNTPVTIDLTEGDMFGLDVDDIAEGLNNDLGIVLAFDLKVNEIVIGDRFPIVENLPSIKVIDFIKVIMTICGLFAVPDSTGNKLRFVSFDTLGDRSNAIDISDWVIPKDETNKPNNISYSLDDFARNNRFRWKEGGKIIADGNIVVEDATLEYERDAVELPFEATVEKITAFIQLYEINDDGEPELQDVEPRLLVEKNYYGYSTGYFSPLYWKTLLANNYTTYEKAVKKPVVLTEKIFFNEIALRDLDVSKPVYIRQYGKYYAIVEVKSPKTGICECKLLQLY